MATLFILSSWSMSIRDRFTLLLGCVNKLESKY